MTTALEHTGHAEQGAVLGPASHDLTAEQALLGSMMLSEDACATALDLLTADMLYAPAHQAIFAAVLEEFSLGGVPDAIRVAHRLTGTGQIRAVGGAGYLHTLLAATPTAVNVAHWAAIVAGHARSRAVAAGLTRGLQRLGSGAEAAAVIEGVSADLSGALTGVKDHAVLPFDQALVAAIEEIERAQSGPDGIVGVPTGLAALDDTLGGLRAGEMTVIGARPAIGKSLLVAQIAISAARAGHPCLLASLEMSGPSIAKRALSAASRVDLTRLVNGTLSDTDWDRVSKAMNELMGLPLDLYCRGDVTPAQIRTEAHRMLLRHPTAATPLVALDYLQLLTSPSRAESRQVAVSDFSRAMKTLAVDLGAAVIVASQLNREVEKRTDKRPLLSDLRESGSVEQDADVVLLLHRDDAYDPDSPRVGEMDLIIAKHRNGPLATKTAAFLPHHGRVADFADV